MESIKLFQTRREISILVGSFLVAGLLFISLSAWATTIGTNMDSTGTLGAATSTPWGDLAVDQQAAQTRLHPVFVVGDDGTTTPAIFVSQKGIVSIGSSTPSPIFLNLGDMVIGRNGSTNDLYVSGGLGVGNATTSDNEVVVGITPSFAITGNKRFIAGASTTAITSGSVGRAGFVWDGGDASFSAGGTGTTTLGVYNEAATNDATNFNTCIELMRDGAVYRIFVATSNAALTVQAGTCNNS